MYTGSASRSEAAAGQVLYCGHLPARQVRGSRAAPRAAPTSCHLPCASGLGLPRKIRYARLPGRPDGWLAPRRTGCSASGHSRSPTALPALWICRWARTLAATGLAVAAPGDQWLRRSGQPRGPGFTSGPRGAAPRPRLRSMRRPALSDRRQGKSCSSAAGRLRSDPVGTSPSAISLAEHRVEFGVGPDLPDLLRAAAGDGDLGSPLQRLLA